MNAQITLNYNYTFLMFFLMSFKVGLLQLCFKHIMKTVFCFQLWSIDSQNTFLIVMTRYCHSLWVVFLFHKEIRDNFYINVAQT